MTDLKVICNACSEPISRDTGYLWINMSEVDQVAREMAERTRDRNQGKGPFKPYITVRGGDLLSYPTSVQWQAHHTVCDPDPDGNAYHIAANRIDTWAELLDWTAHLMEKDWFTLTDWDDVLRGVHNGNHRLVVASAASKEKQ